MGDIRAQVDEDLHNALRMLAAKRGMEIRELIPKVLKEGLLASEDGKAIAQMLKLKGR